MASVVVVGDVMLDVSVTADDLAPRTDVHGRVRMHPGGAGANAAAWAAEQGCTVTLYGRVGDDAAGAVLSRALTARGVDVRLGVDPDAATGALLSVHGAGERSMVADRGANARVSPEDLPDRLGGDAVLVSGYLLYEGGSEAAARAALERADAPIVAVDVAAYALLEAFGTARFLEAAAAATCLFANEDEAAALAGTDADAAIEHLADRFPSVAVKRGPAGAVVVADGRRHEVPAPPITGVVDPTGAGDAFDGTFLARLALGDDVASAARAACEAGARVAAMEGRWP